MVRSCALEGRPALIGQDDGDRAAVAGISLPSDESRASSPLTTRDDRRRRQTEGGTGRRERQRQLLATAAHMPAIAAVERLELAAAGTSSAASAATAKRRHSLTTRPSLPDHARPTGQDRDVVVEAPVDRSSAGVVERRLHVHVCQIQRVERQ